MCSSVWDANSSNPVAEVLARACYSCTWASTEGISDIMHTTSGSGAGTPLADLIYVVSMSKVLKRFELALVRSGNHSVLPVLGVQHRLGEIGFVDDTLMTVVSEACSLVEKTTDVARLACDTFYAFGMVLNFLPGKSEALPIWRSHGIKKAKRRLRDACFTSTFTSVSGGNHILRWVAVYKHVGTYTQSSQTEAAEVASRAAIIRAEGKSLRKVLANSRLSIRKRVNVAQTYIWSKGFFQCGTWSKLSHNHFSRLHAAAMSVYRLIHGWTDGVRKSDDAVIGELNAICPMTMLRARRVLLFAKATLVPTIRNLILDTCTMEGSWSSDVLGDLKWLSVFPKFLECAALNTEAWCTHIAGDYKGFREKVKKICLSPFANLVTQWAHTPSQSLLGASLVCDVCSKVYDSYQQLQLHKSSKHGIKHLTRRYIDGSKCPICLVLFASRDCVINHVRYRSMVCLENLLIRPPKLSVEEAKALDLEECVNVRALKSKGLRRHAATEECIRLSGPLLPIVIDPNRASNHHALGVGHQHR